MIEGRRCRRCRRDALAKAFAGLLLLAAIYFACGSTAATASVPMMWLVATVRRRIYDATVPEDEGHRLHWSIRCSPIYVATTAVEVLVLVRVVGLSWILVYLAIFAAQGVDVVGAQLARAWARVLGARAGRACWASGASAPSITKIMEAS